MILPTCVTVDASKVGLEAVAPAFTALRDWVVVCVRASTLALGKPLPDVESLSSGQPPLAQLLRSSRNELELLAITL